MSRMIDRIARILIFLKPLIFNLVKIAIVTIAIAVVFFVCEFYLLPWLAGSDLIKRLGIFPEITERTTVVERRETVTVTQDENLERLATEHSSIVVRLIPEPPKDPLGNLPHDKTVGFLGTLVTNDGFIVTYTPSSPSKASTYLAWFNDGTRSEAKFVGYDTLTQLAYYHVDRNNTPAAAFTNSDDVKPGRRVVLLGLTQDFRPSIYSSSIERRDQLFNLSSQTVASSEKWEGVLGLAMLPNLFYVGGPALLNNGEMVGVVGIQILDGQEKFFLIPAQVVRESLNRLVSERIERPIAGIYYLSLTEERAVNLGVSQTRGALIYSPSARTGLSIIAGSPAARAGLLYGDIILRVNEIPITPEYPLSVAIGKFNPGDMVELTLLRGGVERNINLSL